MKNKIVTTYDALQHIRGSWNGVNPVTKIVPNKKKQANKKKMPSKS